MLGTVIDPPRRERSDIKSGYVTIIKIQINLPEIRIQKVQNSIVLIVINRT